MPRARSPRAPALRTIHLEVPAPAARAIGLARVAHCVRRAGVPGRALRYASWRERGCVRYQIACTPAMAAFLVQLFARRALIDETRVGNACADASLQLLEAIDRHDRASQGAAQSARPRL